MLVVYVFGFSIQSFVDSALDSELYLTNLRFAVTSVTGITIPHVTAFHLRYWDCTMTFVA